jgi:hypothetical protein
MGRFRFLVVLLLIACLPLKVVAAVAMPFCGASLTAMAHSDHADGDSGHAGHDKHADHGAMPGLASDPASSSDDDCSQCGLCHLACASAIPVDSAVLKIRFAPVLSAAPPGSFVSFVPELLFRPPLRPATTALA